MKTQTETQTQVHTEDVDDIIGLAAQMKDAEAEHLTVQDLEDVAQELDIEPRYVKRAIEKLKAQRASLKLEEERKSKRLKAWLSVPVLALLVPVLVLAGFAFSGASTLEQHHVVVEQKRAQVVNVRERQERIEAKLKGLPMTPDREAELVGSENRVRIETRRYDEAAAAYNRFAVTSRGKLGTMISKEPVRVPLSSELTSW